MYATESEQQNFAPAQYTLARFYEDGVGTTKDSVKAFNLMFSSAQQGFPSAQYYLGIYYYEGFGTTKNIVTGKSWIEKAAMQGIIPAREALTKI